MSLTLTGVSDSGGGGPTPPSTQKIVVAGYSTVSAHQVFAVVRYASDGSRDVTFGTGGLTTTSFGAGTDSAAVALAVQADGKYVAAGSSGVTFALARYSALGVLDSAGFGTGGKVTTAFGTSDEAWAVAIQADGKIVAAGGTTDGATGAVNFALARYDTAGVLDATFGTGGKVQTNFGAALPADQALAVLIQADGKIVAAGLTNNGSGGFSALALARYSTLGVLDATFGTGGKVITNVGLGSTEAFAAALQGDGKIVVAGDAFGDPDGLQDFCLARYNTNGSPDTGFGTGGSVTTSVSGISGDIAFGVATQADGKIVASGLTDATTSASVRYTTAGALDSSFGTGGIALSPAVAGQFWDVAVQSDGKAVAVGIGAVGFGLVRYTTAGGADATFGTAGLVDDNLGGGDAEAIAVVLV